MHRTQVKLAAGVGWRTVSRINKRFDAVSATSSVYSLTHYASQERHQQLNAMPRIYSQLMGLCNKKRNKRYQGNGHQSL